MRHLDLDSNKTKQDMAEQKQKQNNTKQQKNKKINK